MLRQFNDRQMNKYEPNIIGKDIDLHEHTLDEAIGRMRGELNGRNSGNKLDARRIITGRGNRSLSGVPVIKQGVMDWLEDNCYDFRDREDKNDGVVIVFINKRK